MATLVRCGLAVEFSGRALHVEKGAKVIGVEVADPASPTGLLPVRVLGYRREIRFGAREVRQVADSRLGEGRLGIVLRDGLKVVMTKAQPAQLELLLRALKPGAAPPPQPLSRGGSAKSFPAASVKPGESGQSFPAASGQPGDSAKSRPTAGGHPGDSGKSFSAAGSQPGMAAACAGGPQKSVLRRGLRGLLGPRPAEASHACDGGAPTAGAAAAAGPTGCAEAASAVAVASPQKRHCPGIHETSDSGSGQGEQREQQCGLLAVYAGGGQIFEDIMRLVAGDRAADLNKLRESCRQLNTFFEQRPKVFRLGSAACVPGRVSVSMLLEGIAKHALTGLDLSGYVELTASAAGLLEKSLLGEGGASIRVLGLRGCKALSDVAVRKLIGCCPALEVLDLLEIPRLSDRAFDAPLRSLRVVAAGSLGRKTALDGYNMSQVTRGLQTDSMPVAAPRDKRITSSVQITSSLVARMSSAVLEAPAAEPSSKPQGRSNARQQPTSKELGGSPLTHLVLPHCAELRIVPRLPATLLHLDLRGADLQVPEAAVPTWKPLAACGRLECLVVAGNDLLSVDALRAMLGSLPASARLRTLDLSSTNADDGLAALIVSAQPALTHLRFAGCGGLHNQGLSALLTGLRELEALDVAGCHSLEHPLADIEPFAQAVALAQDLAESRARARRCAREAAEEASKRKVMTPLRIGMAPRASQDEVAESEAAKFRAQSPGAPPRQQQPTASDMAESAARCEARAADAAAQNALRLRFLGVGFMDFAAVHLEATRHTVLAAAPAARVVNASLDIFGSYGRLPPTLL